MNKKFHQNSKRIIVRTKDGRLYKEFETIDECVEYFGKSKAIIYNACTLVNYKFVHEGQELVFEAVKRYREEKPKGEDMRLSNENKLEKELRAKETEDETRRRLGLNPYGEWRNDEWLNAMFERVNKELYPDGYDEHAIWLREKGMERLKAGKTRVSQETLNESYKDIDEEFLDYIK